MTKTIVGPKELERRAMREQRFFEPSASPRKPIDALRDDVATIRAKKPKAKKRKKHRPERRV